MNHYINNYLSCHINRNLNRTLFQYGGDYDKKLKLTYIEKESKDKLFDITFYRRYNDEKNMIEIYLSDEIDNEKIDKQFCIFIQIIKKLKIAHIHTLQTINDVCSVIIPEFDIRHKGSFYLKMTIKMLKKYKKKLGINKIKLIDNAKIGCLKGEFKLSPMLLLLKGETFYGKYGFKLVDENDRKIEEQNIKIIKSLFIKDIDFNKIITKSLKYNKLTKEQSNLLDNFINEVNNNQDKKYIDVMKNIFNKSNGNNTCWIYILISGNLESYLTKYHKYIKYMNKNEWRYLDI